MQARYFTIQSVDNSRLNPCYWESRTAVASSILAESAGRIRFLVRWHNNLNVAMWLRDVFGELVTRERREIRVLTGIGS